MTPHSELLNGELTQAFAAILAQEELLAAAKTPAKKAPARDTDDCTKSQVVTCLADPKLCAGDITLVPTCKKHPEACPAPSKVVTCKPDPRLCPVVTKVPTCLPDPRICPVASKIPTCKADPRLCPVVTKIPTCKPDPKICPKVQASDRSLQDWTLPSSQPNA